QDESVPPHAPAVALGVVVAVELRASAARRKDAVREKFDEEASHALGRCVDGGVFEAP
ncbi:hypothetical protein IFR05_017435, partial [Cadophora sp. M221]